MKQITRLTGVHSEDYFYTDGHKVQSQYRRQLGAFAKLDNILEVYL